ncbi:phosphinothricin acetyltransferase [Sulfobacillus thermosulfidooxidans DSM 9293]|uniref:Phosphinothricin acetyltransferase n=1 Tax=Sulfobacillus thermosulfidooxidans (strain DSM 9293 / VKM B-1269 / AT-1) TaxID=929705 RepID=A0A1W1W7M0_SULTA|nr:arsinothricin resistance N-acetyltransferase ArsN1 family A [Sulfobacillus thermosulfidooxidans]SMC02129.1 phosphinothricin acetyltransferase [Sulfobacillus thermosulfidooxidans DSM 9293]
MIRTILENHKEIGIRLAEEYDLPKIQRIYNQGIADRIATLDAEEKDEAMMRTWWAGHSTRYGVLVAESDQDIVGWASLNPYSSRKAYQGVAELSIYIDRQWRGQGVGRKLLGALEDYARNQGFYKIVLFTFPHNVVGRRLYQRMGYREVGTFYRQGVLDGQYVDILAMEKFIAD